MIKHLLAITLVCTATITSAEDFKVRQTSFDKPDNWLLVEETNGDYKFQVSDKCVVYFLEETVDEMSKAEGKTYSDETATEAILAEMKLLGEVPGASIKTPLQAIKIRDTTLASRPQIVHFAHIKFDTDHIMNYFTIHKGNMTLFMAECNSSSYEKILTQMSDVIKSVQH